MIGSRALATQALAATALLACGLAPSSLPGRISSALRDDRPAESDLDRMDHGYYEQVLDAGRRLDDRGATESATPAPPPFKDTPLAVPVPDVREYVLRPGASDRLGGSQWTNNALGLRDRDYDLAKPAGTRRILWLGDSIGAGWGVADGEGMEPRVEAELDTASRSSGGPRIEMLNLAVPGHAPRQRLEHFRLFGTTLQADAVVYQATLADLGWDERRLRNLLARGDGWDLPAYRQVIASAGLSRSDGPDRIKDRLKAYRRELLADSYRSLVSDARSHGMPAVWVLLPRVGRRVDSAERESVIAMARASGFSAIIDLSDAFHGIAAEELAVGPDDYHPNARGHALLAARLGPALRRVLLAQAPEKGE